MKRIIPAFIAVCMLFVALGCSAEEKVTVRLGGLKGPTSMGMVKLLDDAENGLTANRYDYTMAAAADELTPAFLKGELDIVAIPVNLGSILYNKSKGAIEMIAVNTLGVVYIVEKGGDAIKSVADLKGSTIYATGKGSAPEYALSYLMKENGLDIETDVTMQWKSEPTEVVALMATEEHAVAMLPQPFVTVAAGQLENLRIALDLTEEWDALKNGSRFVTAAIFVRKAFADEHPETVSTFIKEYAMSSEYVNSSIEAGAMLVEKYGIVKAPVAVKAIPYCNIVCITGEEMKETAKGCLEVFYKLNPTSVGGELPDDGFYRIDA